MNTLFSIVGWTCFVYVLADLAATVYVLTGRGRIPVLVRESGLSAARSIICQDAQCRCCDDHE